MNERAQLPDGWAVRARLALFFQAQTELSILRWLVPALLVIFVGMLLVLSQAKTLSTASIHSERVSFRVVDPDKAAFQVSGFRVAAPGTGIDHSCVEALVRPLKTTMVIYGRIGKGPIEVWLDPGNAPAGQPVAIFSLKGQSTAVSADQPVYMAADATCGGAEAMRLPLWGIAAFGEEFRPASGPGRPLPTMLMSGEVKVEARSWVSHTLYAVAEIAIPVGSRFETLSLCKQHRTHGSSEQPCTDPDADSGIWWGVVVPDDAGGLKVDAATVAPKLALYRPMRTDADQIAVSNLAQLTKDPDLVTIQFAFSVAVGLIAAVAKHLLDMFGKRGA